MTNKGRQRAYLERQREIVESVSITLHATAGHRLERLARHHGIKQRELLAQILADAENATSFKA